MRLVDDDAPQGRARTFRWSRFVTAGELCDGGGGFGCPDNLAFDPDGNLWMTCDLSSGTQHCDIDRGEGSRPGSDAFQGVFGSNALFYVPTRGPDAGKPVCFAIAPPESELTGPTFTPDGRALILSVQHPGEIHGARRADPEGTAERRLTVAARDGTTFEQLRSVPLGSNWPSNVRGEAPRPAVVCITRAYGVAHHAEILTEECRTTNGNAHRSAHSVESVRHRFAPYGVAHHAEVCFR